MNLARCAALLGARSVEPFRSGESGRLREPTGGDIPWDLRVIEGWADQDERSDDERHHLFWRCPSVRLDDLVAVLGSGERPEDLDQWHAGMGLPPDELEAHVRLLENLADRTAGDDTSSGLAFNESLAAQYANAPVPRFARQAVAIALPHPLDSLGWWMFAPDPGTTSVLTPAVVGTLRSWSETAVSGPSDLRAWLGAPDLRIEARLINPKPQSYELLIGMGLAIAREIIGESAAPARKVR